MPKKKENKEEVFDFSAFQKYSSDILSDMFKGVPDDWKPAAADFISCQSIIQGARDTYQGLGILEVVKRDYLNLCEDFYQSEDNTKISLN